MAYHLIMVFHPSSGYNNTFVLYTKILSLLSGLITDLRISVFEKLPFLRKQFHAQKALTDIWSRFAWYRYG
jgi:hypothetical protein